MGKRLTAMLLAISSMLWVISTLSGLSVAYDLSEQSQYYPISAGSEATAIIDAFGTLWMCGTNDYGELGNPGLHSASYDWKMYVFSPPERVMDNVLAVSCGFGFVAAIKSDHTLWMWGRNDSGQIGLDDSETTGSTTRIQTSPVKILDDVVSVSCGWNHTAAIKTDGTLWTWGNNEMGQLGHYELVGDSRGGDSTPKKVLDGVIAVSCGDRFTGAIKEDGSLWMWGGDNFGQLGIGQTGADSFSSKTNNTQVFRQVSPIYVTDNVKSVHCGGYATAVIKNDDSLWMWGSNRFDLLGKDVTCNGSDGRISIQTVPMRLMDDVRSVSIGYIYGPGYYVGDYIAVIKTDGSLWMRGNNAHGQLGLGTTDRPDALVHVMDNVDTVCCGDGHTIALKKDRTLWVWGRNTEGQLGIVEGGNEYERTNVGRDYYQTTPTQLTTINMKVAPEYIYDSFDYGSAVRLNTSTLTNISTTYDAQNAVSAQTRSMTTEQKISATGADLATLYAETAVAKAASKSVSGNDILINAAAVADLAAVAKQTSEAVESALVSGGVSTARYLANTVTLKTQATGEISICIDPDILTTDVDKITVEAPTYAMTIKVADLAEDLTEILTFTAQDVGTGYAAGSKNKKATVKVTVPKGKMSNPVTLSLPTDNNDSTYQAVVNTEGQATTSKYNPATTNVDGKVNTSGSYTVQSNQKNFTDISSKSAEMQKAINYLASKGIINGTSATTFSPDASISRAEIAALLVRAIGKLDSNAKNSFTDVKTSDWYYSAAGSSKKVGLIKGYSDGTFRGTTTINKEQIVVVAARVLTSEMGYKTPSNTSAYLNKYSDGVVKWAQPEVALATKENLVLYRVDGTFKGSGNMTRGDAAIIIYRLFQRIW